MPVSEKMRTSGIEEDLVGDEGAEQQDAEHARWRPCTRQKDSA